MNLIALVVALPLLGAFLLPVGARSVGWVGRLLGPALLLLTSLVVIVLWRDSGGVPSHIELGGFQPPLGITFYLDQLALVFALATSLLALLLWPHAAWRDARVAALMLLMVSAASGMALSGDLFNLYVFYELVSVASFGLVAAPKTGAALAATLRYVIISGMGTVMALTGIALIYTQTGTLNLAHLTLLSATTLDNTLGLTAFVLILLGIGVKAELFPVNIWVPEVYATASQRVSALLAGLISKLAIIVIIRLLVLLFPQPEALTLLLVIGALGVLLGELAAWHAKDFERMLAFSSIGQLGLVLMAFSIPGQAGLFAGLAVAMHHLIVKPALFVLAERWSGGFAGLAGAGWKSPWAAGLFILFALSLIGVPPLPGFWAKLMTLLGLLGQDNWIYWTGAGIILLATVFEANYLFRFGLGLFKAGSESRSAKVPVHDAGSLGPSLILGAVLLIATVMITPVGNWLAGVADQLADRELYVTTVLGAGRELP